MPPQYTSSAAAATGVTVKLSEKGLYGSAPVLQSAACPSAIGELNCESFAVIDSSCSWRKATASIGAGGELLLAAAVGEPAASAGAFLGSRAYYANCTRHTQSPPQLVSLQEHI